MEGFIGLHIGAGNHSNKLQSQYKKLCKKAAKEGIAMLNQGMSSLDVVESVTALLENSPLTNAGFGSNLTWDGEVECDASIMDGSSRRWGGVGAVPGVKNPIFLARALCEEQGNVLTLGRVPPCLLVGVGARKWAERAGIEVVSPEKMISEKSRHQYNKYKKKISKLEEVVGKMISPLDTVGVVCLDKAGKVAASCSSGGIALKHSGRIGQSAAYASGVWAENEAESAVAVCSSGCGEHLMRTMLAKEISDDVKSSKCPTSALYGSFNKKFLDSPFLYGIQEKLGGAAVLKVDKHGFGEFLWGHTTRSMCLGFMSTSDSAPRSRLSSLSPQQCPGSNVVIEGISFKTRPVQCDDTDDNVSMKSLS